MRSFNPWYHLQIKRIQFMWKLFCFLRLMFQRICIANLSRPKHQSMTNRQTNRRMNGWNKQTVGQTDRHTMGKWSFCVSVVRQVTQNNGITVFLPKKSIYDGQIMPGKWWSTITKGFCLQQCATNKNKDIYITSDGWRSRRWLSHACSFLASLFSPKQYWCIMFSTFFFLNLTQYFKLQEII